MPGDEAVLWPTASSYGSLLMPCALPLSLAPGSCVLRGTSRPITSQEWDHPARGEFRPGFCKCSVCECLFWPVEMFIHCSFVLVCSVFLPCYSYSLSIRALMLGGDVWKCELGLLCSRSCPTTPPSHTPLLSLWVCTRWRSRTLGDSGRLWERAPSPPISGPSVDLSCSHH